MGTSSILEWAGLLFKMIPGVDHVKEVKLGVDRNGRFLPGIVGRAALPNHQVLRAMVLVVVVVVLGALLSFLVMVLRFCWGW